MRFSHLCQQSWVRTVPHVEGFHQILLDHLARWRCEAWIWELVLRISASIPMGNHRCTADIVIISSRNMTTPIIADLANAKPSKQNQCTPHEGAIVGTNRYASPGGHDSLGLQRPHTDLLNVQLAAADSHSCGQLQVVGVVGIDLPRFPYGG